MQLLQWVKKKQSIYAGICFLVVLALVIFVQLHYRIRWQINDDAIMSNIASGAYGGQPWRLVFVNILFGLALRPLYWVMPALNWFFIVPLGIALLCFATLGTMLMNRLGAIKGGAIYCALLAFGGLDFFIQFHYVRYGAFFLAVGFLLLSVHLGQICPATICGGALVLLGSMLRFDNLFAVGGLAAAGLLYRFVKLEKPQKLRALATGICVLLVVVGAKAVDTVSYRLDADWASYTRFNVARSGFVDFKRQYLTSEDLAVHGLSENDFNLTERWAFYDSDIFPVERIEELNASISGNTLVDALRLFRTQYKLIFSMAEGVMLFVVLLAWLLLSGKKKWWVVAATLAIFMAELIYLCWVGRFMERVVVAQVFALVITLTQCFEGPLKIGKRAVWLLTVVLLFTQRDMRQQYKAKSDEFWEVRTIAADEFTLFAEDKENLYLLDRSYTVAANGISVWRPRPEGYFSNIVFTGGWLMHSPMQDAVLEAYGLESLYPDSIDKDNVYYSGYEGLSARYLQEHYNPDVHFEHSGQMGSFNYYRATTEPVTQETEAPED